MPSDIPRLLCLRRRHVRSKRSLVSSFRSFFWLNPASVEERMCVGEKTHSFPWFCLLSCGGKRVHLKFRMWTMCSELYVWLASGRKKSNIEAHYLWISVHLSCRVELIRIFDLFPWGVEHSRHTTQLPLLRMCVCLWVSVGWLRRKITEKTMVSRQSQLVPRGIAVRFTSFTQAFKHLRCKWKKDVYER